MQLVDVFIQSDLDCISIFKAVYFLSIHTFPDYQTHKPVIVKWYRLVFGEYGGTLKE